MNLFLALVILAQFVPPVPLGVKGNGTARHANGPIPFPPADSRWLRVTTAHFDIISDAPEEKTLTSARDLETLAAGLRDLQPTAPLPPATRVILFGTRREAQPYFDLLLNTDDSGAAGIFVAQKSGGSMIVDAARSGDATVHHELVHYLLASNEKRPPLWLEEGLAEYYSSARVTSGAIFAGEPIPAHQRLLHARGAMPLDTLFNARYESEIAAQPSFYATSWTIVDWLMRTNRGALRPFLEDMEDGATVANALPRRFGKSIEQLESMLADARREPAGEPAIRIDVPAPVAAPVAAPMERADVLYELGRFLAGIDDVSGEAERHLRAAVALRPSFGRAYAELAAMRARSKHYDEAEPLFAQAIAASPEDGEIQLSYAESLLRDEIGVLAESRDLPPEDAPRFRKARTLAAKALALGADEARADGAIGISWLIEDDATPGVVPLQRAHELRPGRTDYALHLFAIESRLGNPAAEAIARDLEAAHDAQVAFAAGSIRLRAGLDRVNRLVHQQKLAEAAALLRQMAATANGEGRREMEEQAADLERTSAANAEIVAYNKAIALSNAGKTKAAMQALDDLLKSAKDPAVIADAKKFRAELLKRWAAGR